MWSVLSYNTFIAVWQSRYEFVLEMYKNPSIVLPDPSLLPKLCQISDTCQIPARTAPEGCGAALHRWWFYMSYATSQLVGESLFFGILLQNNKLIIYFHLEFEITKKYVFIWRFLYLSVFLNLQPNVMYIRGNSGNKPPLPINPPPC